MYCYGEREILWLLFAVFVSCWTVSSANSHLSPCSPNLNSQQCLMAVRQLMADENRFWFGQSYNTTCPPDRQASDPSCSNNDKSHLSLLTRTRDADDNSTDVIQQVLNVTFDVPAGSYESCGNTYTTEAVTLTVDPSQTTSISLWSANHVPEASWTAETNQTYTVIVWDAGTHILHGLVFNIMGSSWDRGQTMWNYRGPKNDINRDQPYVFLLYEQSSKLDDTMVRDTFINALSQNRLLAPDVFFRAFSLMGPVGVSVLTVRTDPYATEFKKQKRKINKCPALLTPSFSALQLSYDVSRVRLMTSVDVTFKSPEISVSSCCAHVTIASNSRIPNPLGNGHIQPVYTRNQPVVTLVATSFFDSFYFLRSYYTLLMLDVTQELSGTIDPNTLLHWEVLNIREGDVTSGDTIFPYQGPLPLTGQGDRILMFLLLRQEAALNVTELSSFTSDTCVTHLKNRCRFNLTAFITENRLMIEGASWFKTSPDVYSRQQAISQNVQPENVACLGVSGYSTPCDTATCTGVAAITARVSLMAIGVSLAVLFHFTLG